MVDVIGRAKVIITGDVDSQSIDQAGGKIGNSLKTGALVGAAALGTLAVAGVKAFQSFEEAAAVSRKLSNVLDNMGKGDAAPAIEKLADDLRKLTGIDDEVIKGGQTILATFSDVAESAGLVGGTFDRATRTAVDMSAVFGSVESASRVLGKALSEPEKAAALLRRSNVILNEEQRTLIDNFIAAGDEAGAQDVILSALEDRYAGTAEAAATESQKITAAFEELKENVGQALSELTGGEITSISEAIDKLSDQVKVIAESEDWKEFGKNLRDVAKDAGKVAEVIGDVYKIGYKVNKAMPDWADGWLLLPGPIGQVIDKLDDLYRLYKKVKDLLSSDTTNADLLNKDYSGGGSLADLLGGVASGGRGMTGGLYLVGEEGPEIMRVPSGSDVYSNRESAAMTSGGGDQITQLIFNGPTSLSAARLEAEWANTYGTRFGSATGAGAR